MSPEQRDPAYLWDMLEAARDVASFVEGADYERFISDRMLRLAVERGISIIGEAARRISSTFKEAHPEIPWAKITAQRNVIIHQYDALELKAIWEVATLHVPTLIKQIEPLIPPLPPEVEE